MLKSFVRSLRRGVSEDGRGEIRERCSLRHRAIVLLVCEHGCVCTHNMCVRVWALVYMCVCIWRPGVNIECP